MLTCPKIGKLGGHLVFHVHKTDERPVKVKAPWGPGILFTINPPDWSRLATIFT